MKLFAYYALHTFKNQIKKLFKTWVLIFIVVCIVLGGLIGGVLGLVLGDDEPLPDGDISQTEVVEAPEDWDDFEITLDDAMISNIIELVAGGIVLALIVFTALGADKNGSGIFLPADVSLLFASPMKPQSVLMFRLTTRLGMAVLGSVYLLFQIPNLVMNFGLNIWAALALLPAWCLTIVLATLIQMLLYTLSATYPKVRHFLRPGIYALLVLVTAGYLLTAGQSGGYLESAFAFFNGKYSRFIPIWGWLKGFYMYAVEGNLAGALLSLGATLLGGGLLVYLIWHIPADFYEDAMAKSEETAELLEAAQSESSGGVMLKRKKDRSEKLRRDGLRRGSGANVFFFKTLYNRFRFAHMGFFTKTMEFYLVAALGVGAICRFSVGTTSVIPLVLTLGGLSFFRSLGNPLGQDTGMDYFVMIPESAWAKLFWSLMGGTADCFLDVLLPLLAGALLVGANPFLALLWVPLILSVDFYATNVGTFIHLSVPVSAGKTLKQIVQVLFVYFGLVPDIVIMAVILSLELSPGWLAAAVGFASVFNFGLGFLFFGLSPLFLDQH